MSRICGEMAAVGAVLMRPCCWNVDGVCEMVGWRDAESERRCREGCRFLLCSLVVCR